MKGDLHKAIPKNLNLNEIFCLKEYRAIGNGYTTQWKNRIFLIKNPSITMKKQRVCIMEDFNGKITIKLKGKNLSFEEVTRKDLQALKKDQKAAQQLIKKARVYYRPLPWNHPWKRFVISNRSLAYA